MRAPDFAAILGDAADDVRVLCGSYCIGGSYNVQQAVALQLAAKVPELCQHHVKACAWAPNDEDCNGEHCDCPCENCPNIAQLLAIGAAAWNAIAERDAAYARRENGTTANIIAIATIVAAVMAVQP